MSVHVKEVGGRLKDSLAVALHLSEETLPSKIDISLKSSYLRRERERARTDSDAYLAPFSVLNQHIRRRKRSHYMMVVLSKL